MSSSVKEDLPRVRPSIGKMSIAVTLRRSRYDQIARSARNSDMKEIRLPLPELFGIAATRGLLGAGIALLFGERLDATTRRRLGLVFTSIGVVSTMPFAYDVLHRRRE